MNTHLLLGIVAVCVLDLLGLCQNTTAQGRIAGRVVDAVAEPLGAAEVMVFSRLAPKRMLARTRCDGDGSFVVGPLPPTGWMQVRAVAPSGASAIDYVEMMPGTSEATVRLRVWDAGRIRVRVLDAEGKAIPGCLVCGCYDDSWLFGFMPQSECRTDKDGEGVLEGVTLGLITVRAWAPGFVLAEEVVWLRDERGVELHMQRGVGRELRVNVSGVPLGVDATVHVEATANRGRNARALPEALVHARLDDHGCWDVKGLPDDWSYQVSVSADGAIFAPRRVRVAATADMAFTCVDAKSRELCGVLRDANGRAIAKQGLECRATGDWRSTYGMTDADGRFRMESPVEPGASAVIGICNTEYVIARAGAARDGAALHSQSWHEFTVGEREEMALTAVPAALVSGVAVDSEGRRMPYQRITLWVRPGGGGVGWERRRSLITGRDGTFAFGGLQVADGEFQVGAEAEAEGAVSPRVLALANGQHVEDLRVVITTPGVVEGKVSDDKGGPIPGARVWLVRMDGASREVDQVEILASRNGRYRFTDVAPGRYCVKIVEGGKEEIVRSGPIQVKAAGHAEVDLRKE